MQSHSQEHSGSSHLGAKLLPLTPALQTRWVKTLKQSPQSLSGSVNPNACAELSCWRQSSQCGAHSYMVEMMILHVREGERAKWTALFSTCDRPSPLCAPFVDKPPHLFTPDTRFYTRKPFSESDLKSRAAVTDLYVPLSDGSMCDAAAGGRSAGCWSGLSCFLVSGSRRSWLPASGQTIIKL